MIQQVAIIGSGTMGNGIAHVFAQNGYKVELIDVDQQALVKAINTIAKNLDRMIKKEKITEEEKQKTLANITTFSGNEKASAIAKGAGNADLVIEAATENPEVKFKIFSELDKVCKEGCILATNTSSISITKIAAQTKRPEKVIGMHFMNPVPIMQLVEVIRGYKTSDEVTRLIMDTSKKLGKKPVEVNDFPGFVSNRILMPMINEAIITLNEGVAGVEEIDTVMKLGMAHPMGPLQLADFIGLDVCLSIMNVLYEGLGNTKYAPSPLLINMVSAGNLGVKSGEGFYSWGHGTKDLIVSDYFKK
jgi:3-hydroxybutyryl-CoA dehydrogenase